MSCESEYAFHYTEGRCNFCEHVLTCFPTRKQTICAMRLHIVRYHPEIAKDLKMKRDIAIARRKEEKKEGARRKPERKEEPKWDSAGLESFLKKNCAGEPDDNTSSSPKENNLKKNKKNIKDDFAVNHENCKTHIKGFKNGPEEEVEEDDIALNRDSGICNVCYTHVRRSSKSTHRNKKHISYVSNCANKGFFLTPEGRKNQKAFIEKVVQSTTDLENELIRYHKTMRYQLKRTWKNLLLEVDTTDKIEAIRRLESTGISFYPTKKIEYDLSKEPEKWDISKKEEETDYETPEPGLYPNDRRDRRRELYQDCVVKKKKTAKSTEENDEEQEEDDQEEENEEEEEDDEAKRVKSDEEKAESEGFNNDENRKKPEIDALTEVNAYNCKLNFTGWKNGPDCEMTYSNIRGPVGGVCPICFKSVSLLALHRKTHLVYIGDRDMSREERAKKVGNFYRNVKMGIHAFELKRIAKHLVMRYQPKAVWRRILQNTPIEKKKEIIMRMESTGIIFYPFEICYDLSKRPELWNIGEETEVTNIKLNEAGNIDNQEVIENDNVESSPQPDIDSMDSEPEMERNDVHAAQELLETSIREEESKDEQDTTMVEGSRNNSTLTVEVKKEVEDPAYESPVYGPKMKEIRVNKDIFITDILPPKNPRVKLELIVPPIKNQEDPEVAIRRQKIAEMSARYPQKEIARDEMIEEFGPDGVSYSSVLPVADISANQHDNAAQVEGSRNDSTMTVEVKKEVEDPAYEAPVYGPKMKEIRVNKDIFITDILPPKNPRVKLELIVSPIKNLEDPEVAIRRQKIAEMSARYPQLTRDEIKKEIAREEMIEEFGPDGVSYPSVLPEADISVNHNDDTAQELAVTNKKIVKKEEDGADENEYQTARKRRKPNNIMVEGSKNDSTLTVEVKKEVEDPAYEAPVYGPKMKEIRVNKDIFITDILPPKNPQVKLELIVSPIKNQEDPEVAIRRQKIAEMSARYPQLSPLEIKKEIAREEMIEEFGPDGVVCPSFLPEAKADTAGDQNIDECAQELLVKNKKRIKRKEDDADENEYQTARKRRKLEKSNNSMDLNSKNGFATITKVKTEVEDPAYGGRVYGHQMREDRVDKDMAITNSFPQVKTEPMESMAEDSEVSIRRQRVAKMSAMHPERTLDEIKKEDLRREIKEEFGPDGIMRYD